MANTATAARVEGGGHNLLNRTKAFFRDVRMEMKKVTSPSRKEVQATTIVVIITVFIFGMYFWLVDFAIGNAITRMLKYFIGR